MSEKDTRSSSNVSRRKFVKGVGATGAVAAGIGNVRAQGTTVQWAADNLADQNSEALKQALRDAGLSNDISVEIVAGAWETGKRQDQYQQWLSANRSQPDLLMMDSGWHQPFIVRDQQMNLSEALPQDVVQNVENNFLDLMVQTAKGQNGDLYGVPFFPTIPTMHYRKDLVESAGYDTSDWATNAMSWQRFSEITRDVLDQSDVEYGYTFQAKAYEGLSCCDFPEFMHSWGGTYFGGLDNLFSPVGDRPVTVDEDPVLQSLRMVRTFVHGQDDSQSLDGYAGQIAPEAVLQWSEEPSRKPFTDGNAVMHRNWPYSIKINGADDAFGENLGVMPLPYGVEPGDAEYDGTGGSTPALGGWNIGVNPNTQNEEAALEVLQTMMTDEFQLSKFESVGWMPAKTELMTSQQARNVPILGRYMDTLQHGAERAIPRPATAVWPPQSERIGQQVNAVLSGNTAPAQAMTTLKQQLNSIEQSV